MSPEFLSISLVTLGSTLYLAYILAILSSKWSPNTFWYFLGLSPIDLLFWKLLFPKLYLIINNLLVYLYVFPWT